MKSSFPSDINNGIISDTIGLGFAELIEKFTVLEIPPPGAGLTTFIS